MVWHESRHHHGSTKSFSGPFAVLGVWGNDDADAMPILGGFMIEDEKIVSVAYVESLTGLSRSTIYRYASNGEIPCMKFLGAIRFRKEDIDSFIEKSVLSVRK